MAARLRLAIQSGLPAAVSSSRCFTKCRSAMPSAGWRRFASAAVWVSPWQANAKHLQKEMLMSKEGEVIEHPVTEQETWRDRTRPIIPRIVFVSGGMGGIGSAICQRLGQTGHTVVAGCLPGYEKKDDW